MECNNMTTQSYACFPANNSVGTTQGAFLRENWELGADSSYVQERQT